MTQTWKIRNQVYTHAQLLELKEQGLDPRKDEIVMKFITNPPSKAKDAINENKEAPKALEGMDVTTSSADMPINTGVNSTGALVKTETEEQEFARLKVEKAWLKKDLKARYAELKAKFVK